MSKKRSRTSNFSLELNTQNNGSLPSVDEIEETIAKATNKTVNTTEPEKKETVVDTKKEEPKNQKRIPFTTALTPENRAMLEAAAHEGKDSVADLLNFAIEHYFKEVRPLENDDLKKMFLKLFEKKRK